MLHAKCVIYVKNAIFYAYAIEHMSYINMAIWVSKDVAGPQECRQMPLNNLWISLTAQIFKILTLEIFLCMFWNFLWIMWGAKGRSYTQPRELKFLEEFYITIFNGKISLANSESNFGFFWPPLGGSQERYGLFAKLSFSLASIIISLFYLTPTPPHPRKVSIWTQIDKVGSGGK